MKSAPSVKIGSVFVYRLAVKTMDAYFATHGGIRAIDPQNVPATGGAIIASVHVSHLDPPALACACRHRRLLAMAKEELFDHKAFGLLIGQIGAFPVKRGEADTESIRMAMTLLEQGETMIVFPEGTRGDGETMLPLEPGVGMLAKKTGVPVVPVGICGTHALMPRGRKGQKKHLVTVAFGEPFTFDQVATGKGARENRELFTRELERRILEQCARAGLTIKASGE